MGMKVAEGEGTSQGICMNDSWTWKTGWGLTVGAGGGLGGGQQRWKNWKQIKVHQEQNETMNCDISIQWITM